MAEDANEEPRSSVAGPSHELMAAGDYSDEEDYRRDFPAAWHGEPSEAELVLVPLGISASRFLGATAAERERLIDALDARASRRLVGQTFLCASVALAVLVTLSGSWRMFALFGIAIKAGSDLGRFVSRRRELRRARALTPADLELTEPVGE
jgi:hypothetical protein